MERVGTVTPVIIISYRSAHDLTGCLAALDALNPEPACAVYICENGGAAAFDELCEALLHADGLCAAADDAPGFETGFVRVRSFRLHRSGRLVFIGEASENLGYAGGINAWLSPLLRIPGWSGCWILNPDTVVAPDALSALIAHSAKRNLGMVGSRLMRKPTANVTNFGLRWRRILASGYAVGAGSPPSIEPDPAMVESQIECVSGASCYVTRACIEALAPLDERYFLFFEDSDWGVRARSAGFKLGYAHNSAVIHPGGSSIGSPTETRGGSPLAVYLETRNSILFVRNHYPAWFAWAAVMQFLHALRQAKTGRLSPALRGLIAGVKGETGRPDRFFEEEKENAGRNRPSTHGSGSQTAMRIVKAAISIVWLAGLRTYEAVARRPRSAQLVILYYHALTTDALPTFRWQLAAIKAYGDVVQPDYVGSYAGRPKIAITFDDAFRSVFEKAAPEMAEQDVPFTVFVPTGCIGGAPTWEMEATCPDHGELVADVATMQAAAESGVRFGAHTRTHPKLTALAPEQAREEIMGSKADLERLLGRPIDLFSFPYGEFNEPTLRDCSDAGFRFAYSISPSPLESANAEMLRPRVSVHPSDTKLEFWLKLRGAYSWMPLASRIKRRLYGWVFRRASPVS